MKYSQSLLLGILTFTMTFSAHAFDDTKDKAKNTLYRLGNRPIECSKDITKKNAWRICRLKSRGLEVSENGVTPPTPSEVSIQSVAKFAPGSQEVKRSPLEPWATISFKNRVMKTFKTNDLVERSYFKPDGEKGNRRINFVRTNNRRPIEETNSGYEQTGKKKLMQWYLR